MITLSNAERAEPRPIKLGTSPTWYAGGVDGIENST
jgi:hypothetical protein